MYKLKDGLRLCCACSKSKFNGQIRTTNKLQNHLRRRKLHFSTAACQFSAKKNEKLLKKKNPDDTFDNIDFNHQFKDVETSNYKFGNRRDQYSDAFSYKNDRKDLDFRPSKFSRNWNANKNDKAFLFDTKESSKSFNKKTPDDTFENIELSQNFSNKNKFDMERNGSTDLPAYRNNFNSVDRDIFKRGAMANYEHSYGADDKFNTDENKMASFEAMFRGSGKDDSSRLPYEEHNIDERPNKNYDSFTNSETNNSDLNQTGKQKFAEKEFDFESGAFKSTNIDLDSKEDKFLFSSIYSKSDSHHKEKETFEEPDSVLTKSSIKEESFVNNFSSDSFFTKAAGASNFEKIEYPVYDNSSTSEKKVLEEPDSVLTKDSIKEDSFLNVFSSDSFSKKDAPNAQYPIYDNSTSSGPGRSFENNDKESSFENLCSSVASDFASHKQNVADEANIQEKMKEREQNLQKMRAQQDMNVSYINVCIEAGFIYECLNFVSRQVGEGNTAICDKKTYEKIMRKISEINESSMKKLMINKILKIMENAKCGASNLCRMYQVAIIQQSQYNTESKDEIDNIINNHLQTDNLNAEVLRLPIKLRRNFKKAYFNCSGVELESCCDENESLEATDGQNSDSYKQYESGFNQQHECEQRGVVRVPNILKRKSTIVTSQLQILNDLHEKWRWQLLCHFRQKRIELVENWRRPSKITKRNIAPFMYLLDDESYVDCMLYCMQCLPKAGNITLLLCAELGEMIFKQSRVVNSGSTEKYKSYLNKLANKTGNEYNARELWEITSKNNDWSEIDESTWWAQGWKFQLGIELLEMMVYRLTTNNDVMTMGKKHETNDNEYYHDENNEVPSAYFKKWIPAVYNSYQQWSSDSGKPRIQSTTIPHPMYVKLRQLTTDTLPFQVDQLPMTTPCVPWTSEPWSSQGGGFLHFPTKFVRMPPPVAAKQQSDVTKVCDAMNVISGVAWQLNKKIFDIQLDIFRNGGNTKLAIPPPKPDHVVSFVQESNKERWRINEERRKRRKEEAEMHSLHCNSLFKFSIAHMYQDQTLYLPHSLDFRGRAYPVPPHFNYMGGDESRALFKFKEKRKLGKRGFDWLKIHAVNLTDIKKRESNQARLEYADEIMDDILKSAESPSTHTWWQQFDSPWQLLSACMEISEALKFEGGVENFQSDLAIYQDGSCNGLQHYAAMGRDTEGAKQVNLSPADKPQDIYSRVAENVERFRKQDAEDGIHIAQVLEGFVTRKVVKQTVMTTVYGVTRYGGSEQVLRQLSNLEKFPQQHASKASMYVVSLIFRGLDVMFTSASEIKKWFQEMAGLMAKGGQTVQWTTPLGLNVKQDYYENKKEKRIDSQLTRMVIKTRSDDKKPDLRKQRNAFPPNFVHSLDATHMMLTALECNKQGLEFAAVHDCFWTHACDVDQMNEICRDQFVQLYNRPILENLVKDFQTQLDENPLNCEETEAKLRDLLKRIPRRGDFDLDLVKQSEFFFC